MIRFSLAIDAERGNGENVSKMGNDDDYNSHSHA